jgi:hypothetical protein
MASVVAGAVVVAGVAIAVAPQHALSVVRVLLATTAICALVGAVDAFLATVETRQPGPGDPPSPFESTTTRPRFHRDQPASLSRVRGEIGQSVVRADLAPLSALPAQRLRTLAITVLEREGIDLTDPAHADAVRARLSPQALAAITADRSLRRRGGQPDHPRRSASAEEVAATIHAVLDELDRPPVPQEAHTHARRA